MFELLFTSEADATLVSLEADGARRQLFERINDVLDAIEDDPSASAIRRRRYDRPPIWGVPVSGSGEDWLVLCSETDAGLLIHYIGEDLR